SLYALLAGKAPYMPARGIASPVQIIQALIKGPPLAIAQLAPDATPELVAICEKAMSREPDRRSADVQEMAKDLQAFLEGRVVRAYRTGAWVEFKKWVGRNKKTAAALLAFFLAVVGGVGATALIQQHNAKVVTEKNRKILGFSDLKVVNDLHRE